MNFWFALLTITVAAIAVTGLCVLLMWFAKKLPIKGFDERQQQARGKAANWALWTGFFYFWAIAFLGILLPEEMKEYWPILILVGLSLETLVYYVYCVVNDAHIPLLESPRQRIFWFYLCGVIQLGVTALRVGGNIVYFTEAGKLAKRAFHETPLGVVEFSQLMCGVLFILMATIELVRLLRRKEE